MQYARRQNNPEQELHRRHSWNPASSTRNTSNQLVRISTPGEGLNEAGNENEAAGTINSRLKQQWNSLRRSFGRNEDEHGEGDWRDVQRLQVPMNTENGWLSYLSPQTLWNAAGNAAPNQEPTKDNNRHRTLALSKSTGHNSETANNMSPSQLYVKRSISLREGVRARKTNDAKTMDTTNNSESANNTSRRSSGRTRPNLSFHSREERIVEQTKDFCRDYIIFRLRREGLVSRVKISRPSSCDQWLLCEIYFLGNELEQRNQNLCKNLSKQIGITLRSEEVLRKIFIELALEIITGQKEKISDMNAQEKCDAENSSIDRKGDETNCMGRTESNLRGNTERTLKITWGRIIAVLVIAGALATDCIRQGHAELVNELIEYCGDFFLGEGVVQWIIDRGGWEILPEIGTTRHKETDTTSTWNIILIMACAFATVAACVAITNLTTTVV